MVQSALAGSDPQAPALAPRGSPGSGCLSAREDLNLQLLQHTQKYLECRFRRQAQVSIFIESWEQFYRICGPLLRHYALACHVPRAELEDFVQEVWTELVKSLRDFHYDRQRGRFTSWLYRVVQSKAIDLLRRRIRHPTVGLCLQSQALLESWEEDPLTACERKDQQAYVLRVLTQLRRQVSPRNYGVLTLRWIEGRSMREIASALDLTPEQVRYRLHRMKRKFLRLYNVCTAKHLRSKGQDTPAETSRSFQELAPRPTDLCGS
jgi:RNA polymerase sigma-70 factor (ECF subfamily)